MKTKLLILMSIAFLIKYQNMAAQNLMISKKDGTTVNLDISSIKNISFSNSMVSINTFSSSLNIDFGDFRKINFNSESTKIQSNLNSEICINVSKKDGCLYIINAAGAMARMYYLNGLRIKDWKIEANIDKENIDFLQKGIYLVNIKGITYKFIK